MGAMINPPAREMSDSIWLILVARSSAFKESE